MKFWFTICFERECKDESEAQTFIDKTADKIWDKNIKNIYYKTEELK